MGEPGQSPKTLGDTLQEYRKRKLRISQLESEVKKLRSENHSARSGILKMMDAQHIGRTETDDGFWAKSDLSLTANILEKDRDEAAKWFIKNKLGGMLSSNSRSLAKLVEEMIESGTEVPSFINVSIFEELKTARK
jgi:hypothetical protein